MPKDPKQSAKILFIKECFERERDEENAVTLQDIKQYLKRKNISVSKDETITEAIQALGEDGYGMHIKHPAHSKKYYYLPDEDTCLTPTELQLIVDSVQSSKFLTEKDTEQLIDKLLLLCSSFEASSIKDTARFARPTKNHNLLTLENLESIRLGIAQDRQIAFHYGKYDANKQLSDNSEERIVSPLQLIYCDDNYYLMAWSCAHGRVNTYRIDRIVEEVRLLDVPRKRVREFSDYNKKYYTQQSFHMFGGEQTDVTLVCDNSVMNTVIDQFGYAIQTQKVDDNHFSITTLLCTSNQFFGWVLGLNGAVKIVAPQSVVDNFKNYIDNIRNDYE